MTLRLAPWQRSVAGALLAVLGYEALLGGKTPPFGILVLSAFIGLSYAMLAIGLILVYRANRVINFAQGQIGAAPAMLGILLMKLDHWPYPLALAVTVLSAAALGFLVEVAIIRRFARAPRLVLMIATVGLSLVVALLQLLVPTLIFGIKLHGLGGRTVDSAPPITPFSAFHFEIGGVRFSGDVLVIAVVTGLTVAALALFFRRSNIGLAIRASAENADRALLMGISVRRLSTVVWMLSAVLSALAIFLQTAVTGINLGVDIGPSALIYGLAAAIFARMTSFPRALIGAVGVGILTQSIYYVYNDPFLPGAVMVPVLLVVLLTQRGKLSRGEDAGVASFKQAAEFRPIPPELRRLPEVLWGRRAAGFLTLAAVTLVPLSLDVGRLSLAAVVIVYAVVCVSLVILTGWSGQISLGQWGLSGVGAFIAGWFGGHLHADFFVTLLAAGLAGAVASLVIGLPALRIQGPFLAGTTLAFAISVQVLLLSPKYFGDYLPDVAHNVDRPILYGHYSLAGPLAFYYICLGVLVAALASATAIRRTRAGRVIIGVRDNTRGAQGYGINVSRTRIVAFTISGFWAALAGALFVYQQGALDQVSFDPQVSILLMTIVVIGGVTSLPGAVLGAAYLGILKYGGFGPEFQTLATGLGVLILLMVAPGGVAQGFYAIRDNALRVVARRNGILVPSLTEDRRVATLEEARAGVVRDAHPDEVVEESEYGTRLDAEAVPV
ncbi:MAG: branched-chain amino acid transport system permease protein livM [Actinomycetota bacterium]|jgi:branched-chain amino acid transport system permease protein|nr:branched-chain amino acid transport system permease protein livM [Actinomycetota bacterium]